MSVLGHVERRIASEIGYDKLLDNSAISGVPFTYQSVPKISNAVFTGWLLKQHFTESLPPLVQRSCHCEPHLHSSDSPDRCTRQLQYVDHQPPLTHDDAQVSRPLQSMSFPISFSTDQCNANTGRWGSHNAISSQRPGGWSSASVTADYGSSTNSTSLTRSAATWDVRRR